MRQTVRWPWLERRVDAAGPGHVRRTAAEVTAVGVTCLVLAVLAVLKVVIRPVWRASARRGLTGCMTGPGSGRSTDRFHLMGHLAGCLARLEPVRSDYLELATAALLVALLVVEVWLLTRDRPTRAVAVPRGGRRRAPPGPTGPLADGFPARAPAPSRRFPRMSNAGLAPMAVDGPPLTTARHIQRRPGDAVAIQAHAGTWRPLEGLGLAGSGRGAAGMPADPAGRGEPIIHVGSHLFVAGRRWAPTLIA